MSRSIAIIAACLVLQSIDNVAIAGQQSQVPQKASLEGAVVRVGTDEPIVGARVTLSRSPGASAGTSIPDLITDSHGRFVFKDVDPGSYRMTVASNGFVKQDYGQRAYGASGSILTLTDGQTAKDIVVHLIPTGSISGTVRDSAGQRMVGVAVLLLRSAYNAMGARTLQSAGSGRTDDRGEYRAYFVTPGQYYVCVALSTAPARVAEQGGPPGSPNEVTSNYAPTFYPGVADVNAASIVEIASGQDVRGVDLTLLTAGPFSIRGKLANAQIGQTQSVGVTLTSRSVTGLVSSSSTEGTAGNMRYFAATGTFEFRGLPPGAYGIGISAPTSGTATSRLSAFADVVISNSDVDGVVLNLVSPVSVPARIRFEEQEFSSVTGADRITLQLRPGGDMLATSAGNVRAILGRQTDPPNGTMNIDGLFPGDYQITVNGLPSPDYYVKEIRYDGNDALNHPLHFVPGASDGFEILLSAKAARLTGTVTGVDAQVVLVPDRRDRIDLYRTAITDKNGRYNLNGIPPGEYHVFAWEAIEPFAYFDPNLLKRSETEGKPVHMEEGARDNIDLRIIPAIP